jgi:hypothetical protein
MLLIDPEGKFNVHWSEAGAFPDTAFNVSDRTAGVPAAVEAEDRERGAATANEGMAKKKRKEVRQIRRDMFCIVFTWFSSPRLHFRR